MNGLNRVKLNQTITSTLSAMEKLKKNESKIKGHEKHHEEFFKGYEEFLKVIDTFKKMITDDESGPKELKLDLDEELSNEIWQEIKVLEGPAKRKNKEEKVIALQNSLFWEKLYALQDALTDLQDPRLKRGRKVEKIDPSAEGDKE